jgi:hypothetical protein
MAVSSLSRMTVPLASDQSSNVQGLLMPKLKYRFRVYFENFGVNNTTTELTKQVMDFTRPNVTFENIDLPIYNSTIKLAGKYQWQDLTCQVRDDAGGNVSKLVGEQLQKQLDFMEMSSAAAGIDYKFLTRFQILDGGNGANEPVALETWEIYGCYLQSVNYNDMNYGTSEAATISMTIRFDNAAQLPGGVGDVTVASQVGRTLAQAAGGTTGVGVTTGG